MKIAIVHKEFPSRYLRPRWHAVSLTDHHSVHKTSEWEQFIFTEVFLGDACATKVIGVACVATGKRPKIRARRAVYYYAPGCSIHLLRLRRRLLLARWQSAGTHLTANGMAYDCGIRSGFR